MAINYLECSSLYQKTVKRPVRERRSAVAPHLDECYCTPGEGRKTIDLIQKQIGMRRGLSDHGFYVDFRLFRIIYEKYLTADEEQKAKIIAEAEVDHNRDHAEKDRSPMLHAVWCLSQDNIRTMDDIRRLHEESEKASMSQPESEAHAETGEESVALRAEEPSEIPPLPIPVIQRPFRILADAIQDIAGVEERLYYNVEEMQETTADIEKRLSIAEKENLSLKQKLGDCEQRLSEIENALTADPSQLATIQIKVRRLKRDIVIGLPQTTQIGVHWKKEHAVVYRKPFNRFLRDKGLDQDEKDAVIETVEEIATDPFRHTGATEIRWNGDSGKTIPGMNVGETYYHTHVGNTHLRVRWVIRKEEGRVHLIDAFRKTTNKA
ncbi:MAG: hypothetical protein WAP52_04135 [Candidatus Sungiibacteriota bacterium]